MRRLSMAALAATCVCAVSANVKPVGIFSNDMVLQRGKPVQVWGEADPGEQVTVTYGDKTATGTACAGGCFRVTLPALDVEKTGKCLVVKGKNTVTFKNVVVGDVWLVSGQSNSEMPFSWGILNGAAEMAKAKDYPNIRQIKFNHVRSAFPLKCRPCNAGGWKVCTEKTLPGVTAEGYFMAREINAKTGVPIGILDDNWSGCRIEPFICEEGMKLAGYENELKGLAAHRAHILDWCEKMLAAKGCGCYDKAGLMPDAGMWTSQHNAMIEPIVTFPIAGATWYQGCSNGGERETYAKKLEALIGGWRAKWGYDFPFYIVQLASFTAKTTDPAGGNGYAGIRDAMRVAAQTIPNTGLAVTIDIGNAKDIHPKNKYDVGARLARWALRDVYGFKDLVVSGPLYRAIEVRGCKAYVSFDHVGSGLFAGEKGPDTPGVMPTPTPDGKLRGFAIAGKDGKWFWADAAIDGCKVVVSAKEVTNPVSVRYAFRANPMGDCNLYNREGLPASPFEAVVR